MPRLLPRMHAPDDRPALRVGEHVLDYRTLAQACAAHVQALEDAGVQSGDRVGVWTQPHVETAIALVGNALAGVVSVPLDAKAGTHQVAHVVADAAPRLMLAAVPEDVRNQTPDAALHGIVTEGARAEALPERAADETPLLILYTSGTTGPPKGAVVTAHNVATNLDALARAWHWSAEDTVVHALPLFHVHGLVLGLFGNLRIGGTLAWVPRFTPEGLATALQAGGTMLFAVPTMYHRLADAAEHDGHVAAALGSARVLISGSAPLPVREHRRIEQLCGRGVYERYGLTETLIDCAVRVDGPPRPGLVGPPLDGIELQLVDDARHPLEVWDDATLGEVAVRGPNVFAGYLHRPDATAEMLDAQGWLYTGDLATRTADGSIRIVGRRATDLIKTGGYRIGAGEVETCLREDPGVHDVAVVGEPDDDLGERIVAYVVPVDASHPPSPDDLIQQVADALGPAKRPRAVRYLDTLPRNAMGKVQKSKLG